MTVTTRSGTLPRRFVVGFGTAIVVGALLGASAWTADELGFPWSAVIPTNAIGAWLGLAFVLGTTARSVPTGALRGVVGLLAAVAAYYLLIATFGAGFRAIGASHAAVVWGAVALAAGPAFGAAGGAWRHLAGWRRAVAVGMLAAALLGEGIVFGGPRLAHVEGLATDPGAVVLLCEIGLGLVLPALLLARGERLAGYLSTADLGLAGGLAIGPVWSLARELADRF